METNLQGSKDPSVLSTAPEDGPGCEEATASVGRETSEPLLQRNARTSQAVGPPASGGESVLTGIAHPEKDIVLQREGK